MNVDLKCKLYISAQSNVIYSASRKCYSILNISIEERFQLSTCIFKHFEVLKKLENIF